MSENQKEKHRKKNDVEKYIKETESKISKNDNLYILHKLDRNLIQEVINLRKEIFSIENSRTFSSENNDSSFIYLSLTFNKDVFETFDANDQLVYIITNFRLLYEENYVNRSLPLPRNPILHLFIVDLLRNINILLQESCETGVKLYKASDRINYYNKILKSDNLRKVGLKTITKIFASIDSLINVMNRYKDLSEKVLKDQNLIFLTINTQEGEEEIDYETELREIGNISKNNNCGFLIVFDPSKNLFIQLLFYLKPSVFHYCGHSHVEGILFPYSNRLLDGEIISEIYQKNFGELRFSFINSCSTYKLANNLSLNIGTQSIGTLNDIYTDTAEIFARCFYRIWNNSNMDFDQVDNSFKEAVIMSKQEMNSDRQLELLEYQYYC